MDNQQIEFQSSLLDKLRDEAPENKTEKDYVKRVNLNFLRQSIKVDLENLLNTKVCWQNVDVKRYPELASSSLNYGLPDFVCMNMVSDNGKSELVGTIEKVIKRYESRFKHVKATILDNKDKTDRTMRLKIDVILMVDDYSEKMTFDTEIDSSQTLFKIKEGRS